MSAHQMIFVGADRLRIGPWRGSAETASIVPYAAHGRVAPEAIERCLDELRARGYRSVITSALGPREAPPFAAAGFDLYEELHLLSIPLVDPPARAKIRLRRCRKRDWPRVLEIDHLAFSPFWRFDKEGIRDALAATPSRRFRVTRIDPTAGYSIAGRGGPNGYLQRIAVHPDHHGEGLGLGLVSDALSWMHRSGATNAFVNTQLDNASALALYERVGFELDPRRLAVFQRALG